jgi:hypothetical protein
MMSTPTNPAINGRARKSQGHLIDRFDSILDGLADALNESVADAVRDADRQPVGAVVAEPIANPDVARVLAAVHGLNPQPVTPPGPPAPKGPSLRDRVTARWRRLRSGIPAVTGRAVGVVSERLRTTRAVLTTAVRLARADRRGLTAAVGVVVAVVGHLCGPAVGGAGADRVAAKAALPGAARARLGTAADGPAGG